MKLTSVILSVISIIVLFLLINSCDSIIQPELPSGTPLWARSTVGGTVSSNFFDIAVGTDGIYAAGTIGQGTIDFGNGVTVTGPAAGSNILLVKYDHMGMPIWARSMVTATGESFFSAIAIGPNGVYVAGWISEGDFHLGNAISLIDFQAGSRNGFLVNYDFSGNPIWINLIAGPVKAAITDIVFKSDYLFCVGSFFGSGPYKCGGNIFISGPDIKSNAFLVKYDTIGQPCWAKTNSAGPGAFFASVDANNDIIYAAGFIFSGGIIDFGDSITIATPYSEICPVIVKFNYSGKTLSVITTANSIEPEASVFEFIRAGNDALYVCGKIHGEGEVNFGSGVMVAGISTSQNCLIAKYSIAGEAQWARSITNGTNATGYNSLLLSKNDDIFVCGILEGFSTFSFGSGIQIDTFCSINPILIKYNTSGTPLMANSIDSPGSAAGCLSFFAVSSFLENVYIVGSIDNGLYGFKNGVSIKGSALHSNGLLMAFRK